MKAAILLLAHLLVRAAMLIRPGRVKAVLAENLLLKHQLLILRRPRRRAPNLRPTDRLLFGFATLFLNSRRLLRAAIVLQPSTLLCFHRQLVSLKCRFLYSSYPRCNPGPKGPAPELIEVIC